MSASNKMQIVERCEDLLVRNEEYLVLQTQLQDATKNKNIDLCNEMTSKMQTVAIIEAYKMAYKDFNSLC